MSRERIIYMALTVVPGIAMMITFYGFFELLIRENEFGMQIAGLGIAIAVFWGFSSYLVGRLIHRKKG